MADTLDDKSRQRNETDDEFERDLLQRVATGDRDALTVLYARYHRPVLRFVQRLTGDIETAHEAVNDVMLVVWQRAGSFSGNSKVSTWILGIAYRRAMKLGGRLHRWVSRFKVTEFTEAIERSSAMEGFTKELMDQDLMYRAIQQLPEKQRAVVELTCYFGYSYEEIAQIVECPVNTVKTRMFHARAKLRELLKRLEGTPDR